MSLNTTMCHGISCPLKETCYRFLAEPSIWKSCFVEIPYKNGDCEYYIDCIVF